MATVKKRTTKKTATKKAAPKKAAKKTTKKVVKKTAAKKPTKKVAKKTAAKKPARKVAKKTTTKKVTKKAAPKKKAVKKAAPKKKTVKKAAPKKKTTKAKRKPNPAFMRPMTPSVELAAIVGAKALPRTEVTKKVWAYIKKNNLQDAVNRRMINADDSLQKVFGGKKKVDMFQMTKLVNKHLK